MGRASGRKKQRRIKKTALEKRLESLGLEGKMRPLRPQEVEQVISLANKPKEPQ